MAGGNGFSNLLVAGVVEAEQGAWAKTGKSRGSSRAPRDARRGRTTLIFTRAAKILGVSRDTPRCRIKKHKLI
jgi:hypothetical protein